MYVDIPSGTDGTGTQRIRLGDFRIVQNIKALAAEGDWTETALYYLIDENALARWDKNFVNEDQSLGKWTVINDTQELTNAITKNATDIGINAAAISGLDTRVGAIEDQLGSGSESGTILERLKQAEENIASNDTDIANLGQEDVRLAGLIGQNATNIGTLTTNLAATNVEVAKKANQTDLTALQGTVTTLSETVTNNYNTLDGKIGDVATDLSDYETANDAALDVVRKKAEANGTAINNLQAADQNLQTSINNLDKKLTDNYVLNTTYTTKVGELEDAISDADEKAQSGVDKADAAQSTANDAKNAAAANAGEIVRIEGKFNKTQADLDKLEASVGTVPADKTIVQMIADAQTNATYDDTQVKADIAKNAQDIAANGLKIRANELAITNLQDTKADKTTVNGINNTLTTLSNNFETYKTTNDKAVEKAQIDATKANDDLKAHKEAYATKMASLEAADTELQDNIDKKADKTTVEALTKTVGDNYSTLNGLITTNKNNIAANAGEIEKNTTEIGKHETRLNAAEAAIATKAAQSDLNTTNSNLSTLTDNFNAYTEANDEAVEKAQADATQANKDLATHKTAYNTKVDALDAKDAELQKAIDQINTDLGDYVLTETYNAKVQQLEKSISDADKKAQTGVDNAKTAQDTIDEYVTSNNTRVQQIETNISNTIEPAVDANTKAIAAINHAETGILKQAKDYADGKDAAIAEAKKAGTDAQATINSYKTTNDNRVANIEADITDNVKTAIQDNADALSDILNGTKLDSFADVEAEIAASFAANDALVFKGVLAAGTHANPTGIQSGWTYKAKDNGTYTLGGTEFKDCRTGDLFIYVDGAWQYVPSGNEAQDTIGIASKEVAGGAQLSINTDENRSGSTVSMVSSNDSLVIANSGSTVTFGMVWGSWD